MSSKAVSVSFSTCCTKNNKRSNSTALTEEGHDIQNGINFSCFVAGVFLPEMAIAVKKGDAALLFERFEQILYILPITDDAYSFVIAPLFALIPQCAYYSNISDNTANHIKNIIENLLKRYKVIMVNKSDISVEKLYFLKKNITSLETLRVNLFLMDFYQKNQRWPTEDEIKKISLFFASELDYHSTDGSFSYKLFFSPLKMMSKVNGMPKEENEKIIIRKVMKWVPFEIIPIR